MNSRHIESVLPSLDLFGDLDARVIRDIAEQAEHLRITAGEVLFYQGDPEISLYVVISGRLCAVLGYGTPQQSFVGEIAPGETIGEMSILTEQVRSATVVAMRDSELLRISGPRITRLFLQRPKFLMRLSRMLVRRLQKTMAGEGRDARVRTVALMFLHPGVDGRRAEALFLDAFRRIGSTTLAGVGQYEQSSSTLKDGFKAGVIQWLHEQEREYSYVLLPAMCRQSEWDRFCIGQADRVLLVTLGGDLETQDFTELPMWKEIIASPYRRIELAVIHPKGPHRPQGTGRFLRRHGLEACYHLRDGNVEDFERTARSITGKSNGLVLGGGGARGFAHVGVIRALQEHGIQVDHVCGTSMGAFVAAECAMGMTPGDMSRLNREVFIVSNPTSDYTLPLVSVLAGRKCNQNLQRVFGDKAIEDLWLPYFCVSASLTRSEPYIHASGAVWEAVRASLSIPGVFPPVVHDGQVLVDGGIVNNLPVTLARKRHDGRIIAVEVSGSTRMRPPIDIHHNFSPWDMIGDRLRHERGTPRVPSILEILMSTGTFGKEHSLSSSMSGADLYIQPALEQYQTLDWRPMDEIVEIGYRETCRVLEQAGDDWT